MSLLQEIFPLLIPIFVIDVILPLTFYFRSDNIFKKEVEQGYVACNLSGYPYVWPDYLFCFWER